MKKFYLIIASFFLLINSYATDYVVSGSRDQSLNGVYIEAGVSGGKPYFVKAAANGAMEKALANRGGCWQIGDHFGNGMVMGRERSCDAGDPPLTGWGGGITIAPNGPSIKYIGTTTFKELISNSGSVTGSGYFAHNLLDGQGFAGEIGDDFISMGMMTISNLNDGLQVSITKISNDSLKLVLSGQATQHSLDSSFVINFTDNAFSGGGTLAGTGGTDSKTFSINFINEFYVASSGTEFNTISAAVAAAGSGDIIHISGETYTESISTDKGLIFKGEGADKTIVQAAGSYNTASDRVFNIEGYNDKDTTEFHNLTVRYGKCLISHGGGISGHNIKLSKCRIIDNIANSWSGGINCNRYLEIIDCEISGNKCTVYGGGITCGDSLRIVNSTFSNNVSGIGGGGLFANKGSIINSTITNNRTDDTNSNGKGIYIQYPNNFSIVNTIIYGNADNDLYFINYSLNAIKSIIGTYTKSHNSITVIGDFSSTDPLLLPLAFNGGVSQTHALQEGSPAINSGSTSAGIPTKDQRGFKKVGTSDIGAFEFGATGQVDIALTENACSFFIFGEDTLRTSGTFTRTLGDTLYTLNLTIKNATTGSETVSNCGSYIWTVDGQTYTQSGTYTAVLTNAAGCDSTITLNLTIKEATIGSETVSNCGAYTWATNGQTYTQNGTYTATLTNAVGCDSTITLNLTINELPTASVSTSSPTTVCQGTLVPLNANTGDGLTYVWRKNNTIINGATNATYSVINSGFYEVEVSHTNGCKKSSAKTRVIVNSVPAAGAISGANYVCKGTSVKLTPTVAGGVWSVLKPNLAIIDQNGNITGLMKTNQFITEVVAYTVTNIQGCSATVKRGLGIDSLPVIPIISGPDKFCSNGTALYRCSNLGSVSWTAGPLLTASSAYKGVFTHRVAQNGAVPSDNFASSITATSFSINKVCTSSSTKNIQLRTIASKAFAITAPTNLTVNAPVPVSVSSSNLSALNTSNRYWTSNNLSNLNVINTTDLSTTIQALRISSEAPKLYFNAIETSTGCGITAYRQFTVTAASSLVDANSTQTTSVNGVHLYPNPSNGKFTIENTDGATSVKLVDLSGRVIATQPIVTGIATVDFSGVAFGKYMVHITGETINEVQPIVIE